MESLVRQSAVAYLVVVPLIVVLVMQQALVALTETERLIRLKRVLSVCVVALTVLFVTLVLARFVVLR